MSRGVAHGEMESWKWTARCPQRFPALTARRDGASDVRPSTRSHTMYSRNDIPPTTILLHFCPFSCIRRHFCARRGEKTPGGGCYPVVQDDSQ